ncbi:hypothetical protein SK128_010197 [Halocaridina rubra]|uniref:Uncharacterized protein n=1 Tax=Halocaridina rubra TaxID=373956 RepID=A0AAN8XKP2_HALRR
MAVDNSTIIQAPAYHLLRNAIAPAIAQVFVSNFRDTDFVQKRLSEVKPSGSQHHPLQPIDFDSISLFEFLKKVHNRGKKEEDKKRKANKNVTVIPESHTGPRTLHINNLNDNEDLLSKLRVKEFFNPKNFAYLAEELGKLDVTLLLTLVTNAILLFSIPPEVLKAVDEIKDVRNGLNHSGRKVKYEECQKTFELLCCSLEIIYRYLGRSLSDLQEKEREARMLWNIDPHILFQDMQSE